MTQRDEERSLAPTDGPPVVRTARPDAGRRTTALTVFLAVVASSVLWAWWPGGHPVDGTPLRWWSVALLAVLTDVLVFHLEFRREAYTFTFAEVLLVLGMFLAPPGQLIVGRLVGEVVVLVILERQQLRKVMLNLSMFYGECVVLLLLHYSIAGHLSIDRPLAWAAALPAVVAAEMVGFLTVAKVIRWHGGPFDLRSIVLAGLLTAPVNTSLGLTAGILLTNRPWATFLLAGVAVFLFIAYRSYADLSKRHESLTLLYDFTRLMSGSKRPDVVLEAILGQAKDLLRAERAEIWIADEADGFVALQVDDSGLTERDARPDLGPLLRRRFTTSPATIVVTKRTDAPDREIADLLDARDCMVSPITESGKVVGFIAVADRVGDLTSFEPSDARMFETLASHASIALENGRLIDRLHDEARQREHEALHDALTGLPNRVLFHRRLLEQLAIVEAHGGSIAVAVMDLDGFKEINDTLGHQSGDVVLGEVARRLTRTVDKSMTVARLGGDEFALLFPLDASMQEIEASARRVREIISTPMPMEGLMLEVGVSIGLASSITEGTQSEVLLQRADVAMYGAKAAGGGYSFYRQEADENTPRRLSMVNDLRGAIEGGQLFCLYQPKARLADGRIIGVEALVRWRHPVLGMIFPDEFIPLAERSGLIANLTRFVLETALRQAAEWGREGLQLSVAVNLSMRNLLDSELAELVGALIAESGVVPEQVTLEITESNVMSDPARTITVLNQLSDLGVRLSIDDFGTGYSSLSYLQRVPADELKIDKSFVFPMVDDAGAASLVRSIIDLAHNLGLEVVAEGIEDERTWDMLRSLGCEMAQGYFLARPITAGEVVDLCLRQTVERLRAARAASRPDPEPATGSASSEHSTEAAGPPLVMSPLLSPPRSRGPEVAPSVARRRG